MTDTSLQPESDEREDEEPLESAQQRASMVQLRSERSPSLGDRKSSGVNPVVHETEDAVLDVLLQTQGTCAIIEDDPAITRAINRFLNKSFSIVSFYADAVKFLAAVYDAERDDFSVLPHVILCDTNLPNGLSGDQMYAKLTEILTRKGVTKDQWPVMMAMSGRPNDTDNQGSIGYYSDNGIPFYRKPLNVSGILADMKEAIKAKPLLIGN